ncbi:GIY-YIG nuclease family protein [Marinomonas profundimaris]|uniref:Bacteriophage T5 Orf172 DNA-binding domain-containing protein n=1 Tax=Marinomonas profundimaris TaxID=1208321 RepID=W1RNN9_9GAMM|nr:GIY-YIG nuclease family protein [Marinomonas profundimaris]ETI58057.1 hypothetical protein D104_15910 [Marinomonas profundimaris]
MAKSKFTDEDDLLLAELGVEIEVKKAPKRTAKEERIIAGFEEIQRFFEENSRPPLHGEDRDIFERIYATRLDSIRANKEAVTLIQDMDHQGLLVADNQVTETQATYDTDDELLEALGVNTPQEGDVNFLKHVKTRAEVRAAEEIATRTFCEDFETFAPMFELIQKELKSGIRDSLLIPKNVQKLPEVKQGDWFILFGQKTYIANFSKEKKFGYDNNDYRLRVIYDNKTESDLLLRSLQKALERDEGSRRIIDHGAGPLFSNTQEDGDFESGIIYVLQSRSEFPYIKDNHQVIHKIGVTNDSVERRISSAKDDPTFLMAEVEIVAQYQLFNINRTKLEALLHRFFEDAKLSVTIIDRFGKPIVPREWFLVPLSVIDEVVEKLKDGCLSDYRYDTKSAKVVEI